MSVILRRHKITKTIFIQGRCKILFSQPRPQLNKILFSQPRPNIELNIKIPVQPTQTPNIDGVPEVGNINNPSGIQATQGHQLAEGIGAGNIEGVGDSKIEGVGGGGLGVLENIQGNNEQAPSPPAADSVPQNQSGEENE